MPPIQLHGSILLQNSGFVDAGTVAQEPHLKYVWCTHTICQYGENYAFITNRATTAPKEQCERTKIGHFAILLDRCAC